MSRRGNIVFEFLLALGVWSAAWIGLILIARMIVLEQRAHRVARFGAMLAGTGRVTDATVQNEMTNYVAALPSSRFPINWTFSTAPYTQTAASRFYRFVQVGVRAESTGVPAVAQTVVSQKENPL